MAGSRAVPVSAAYDCFLLNATAALAGCAGTPKTKNRLISEKAHNNITMPRAWLITSRSGSLDTLSAPCCLKNAL